MGCSYGHSMLFLNVAHYLVRMSAQHFISVRVEYSNNFIPYY
jgi:hypothetical protein